LREFYEKEAEKTRRYDSKSFWDSRYHSKRKKRLLTLLSSSQPVKIFIDAGCGTGEYVAEASRFSSKVVGLDISKTYLTRIKQLNARTDLIQADARALPLQNKCAECVLCSETIEHLPNPSQVIGEISRVASAKVVISTPNYGILRMLLLRVSAKSVLDLDKSVGHLHIFTLNELLELVRAKCDIASEEVLHVTPPIIGELLHIPSRLTRVVDALESLLETFLPTQGNISIIICNPP
jgi:ubiquinone/menaquinone biosynthesis C-methylase UbiE